MAGHSRALQTVPVRDCRLAVTFLLTVFADLTIAVEAGMILAVLVFIRKVTQTTTVSEATTEYIREGHVHILQHKEIPA